MNVCGQCDLEAEGLVRNKVQMDEYCRNNNFAGWYETSAKENINIDEAARSAPMLGSQCV